MLITEEVFGLSLVAFAVGVIGSNVNRCWRVNCKFYCDQRDKKVSIKMGIFNRCNGSFASLNHDI